MYLTVYSERQAARIEVDDVLDNGARGPALVTEVRHLRNDKDQLVVEVYWRPAGTSNRRREVLRLAPHDVVRVFPNAEQFDAVWEQLRTAVHAAASKWRDDRVDDNGDLVFDPPWEVSKDDSALSVYAASDHYTVTVQSVPDEPLVPPQPGARVAAEAEIADTPISVPDVTGAD